MTEPLIGVAREEPLAVGGVGSCDGGDVAPDLSAWEHERGEDGEQPGAAGAVALVHREERVERAGRGKRAAAVGGGVEEAEESGGADVALLDRHEPEAARDVLVRGVHRGCEVVRPVAAIARLGAQGGVAMDLLAGRLRVPEEVTRRVDSDHHGSVDALRVAPGVDHRGARAGALADQVDGSVAERLACKLEVVDPLGQRVAGEIDALSAKPGRASTEGAGVGGE